MWSGFVIVVHLEIEMTNMVMRLLGVYDEAVGDQLSVPVPTGKSCRLVGDMDSNH